MSAIEIALAGYLAFGQVTVEKYPEIVKHGGLQVQHADGAVTMRLAETGRHEDVLADGRVVRIDLQDESRPFYVTRYVRSWNDCAAVETWVVIRHEEAADVRLLRADSFAAPVAIPAETVKVMGLTGAWAHEANVAESIVGNGQIVELASRSGTRDAWESNAAMMVQFQSDVSETSGRVLGLALEWTGTTCRRVRRSWNGKTTEVFAGVDMTTGPYVLAPGRTFVTPKAILVYSEAGRGEVSRQFHRWARRHCLPHGEALHDVLLNSWEGSYFSFTEETLLAMMDGVKAMGGEMFVLDDGWFGKGKYARDEKNKATVGLGDWYANDAKLPHGLGWLAKAANDRGLRFGLWVEPEMVNTKSWLAEAHPDWILRETDRPLVLGRGGSQVVLDLTNPAVRDYLFETIDTVYAEIPTLAYVKWDCNQNLSNPGSSYLSPNRQANLWYDYTVGLYDLFARYQTKRPDVMVQACASGGGHVDFGLLRYCDEFWTSDCTDPLARVFIQWGTSMFYPANAMACHVTASPNHQTGRKTPLKYRFDVAMSGRLGFELHPKDLSSDELAFAKRAVADYKRIRNVVQQGDLYRLVSPYENDYAALMYVNADRTQAVVFILGLDRASELKGGLKLQGLAPELNYRVQELTTAGNRQPCDGTSVAGVRLMSEGLPYTLTGPYGSAVFYIESHE